MPATQEQTGRSDRPRAVRAWRSPKAWFILCAVLVVGLVFDISTKYWSFANVADQPIVLDRETILAKPNDNPIPYHEGISVLPWGLLDFRLVINRGAVFGLGEHRRVFFIAFTMGALIAGLIIFARMTTSRGTMAHLGIGFILAGGIGNLYDRAMYGAVRDFLHLFPGWNLPFGWNWPRWFGGSTEIFPWVFNIADMMLLTGMALLMIHINRAEKLRQKQEQHETRKKTQPQEA